MIELSCQILGDHVLVHSGASMKAQAALLKVGDELLLRGRHFIGI